MAERISSTSEGKILGTIDLQDLFSALEAEDVQDLTVRQFLDKKAAEIARNDTLVLATETIHQVVCKMNKLGKDALLVVDENGHQLGIVTRSGLVAQLRAELTRE